MIRRLTNLSCVILAVIFTLNSVLVAEEAQTEYSVSRLFMGKNRTYSENEDSVERGVVLLDFFNDACGPCRSMVPAVDSLVQRGYRISKINTDKFPDWARRFGVSKIPCFVVIVDGREVARHTGVTTEENLERLLVRAGGRATLPPSRPGNFSPERVVQNSESAWRGRETNVSVQDIMSGKYVFSDRLNGVNSSALVASSAGSATSTAVGSKAVLSANAAVSSGSGLSSGSSQSGGAFGAFVSEASVSGARGSGAPGSSNFAGASDFSGTSGGLSSAQKWQAVAHENSRAQGGLGDQSLRDQSLESQGLGGRESGGNVPLQDLSVRNGEILRMNRSRILSSTVRIRVYADGEGNGTGTLVDSRSGHALILTCGHLFSEFKKGDSISVDVFTSEGVVTLPGNYVHHDRERDLGLLTLAFSGEIETSPVAGLDCELRKGMPVTTCGCSNGESPTLQQGRVTHLNRYLGPSNIETSAVPVPGRSGGGMFTEKGELIGVCFAADPEEQEGLFTSLSEIHAYFRSLKMERFLLEPRNESKREQKMNENVIALQDLPQRNGEMFNGAEATLQNSGVAANSFQPVSASSSLSPESGSVKLESGRQDFAAPQTTESQSNLPPTGIRPTSQFTSSADMAGKIESIPLKKAERDYVSLSEMDTVAPIVPSEEIPTVSADEGERVQPSVTLVPERALTGEATPAWPPRWSD